jgi:queuine/archaeosine tRNA-ribosyltransferase
MTTIDFQNLVLSSKDTIQSQDFYSLVLENDGSFTKEDQNLTFKQGDYEISVDYDIFVNADVDHQSGSYFTPSYSDGNINSVEIEIKLVYIDGSEVELTEKDLIQLNKIIKSEIS